MAPRFDFYTICVILALASTFASAADPNPLQDFCVAVDQSADGVYVNGAFCKNPNLTTSDDFYFNGVLTPANTSNKFGSNMTHFFVDEVPGLNTLGVALARIDYAVGGFNQLHHHSRSSEILTCLEGTLHVGFWASNPENRFFNKTLNPGDSFIFPVGTIHFEQNVGETKAVALASFGSQNPAVYSILINTISSSNPAIKTEILAMAYFS